MQAVILNSGMGSRMGELTKDKHKSMVEIEDDMPLVIYQIETLAKAGVTDFIMTTGHMADKLKECIEKHFGEGYSFAYVHNKEYSLTNYIYSLMLALPQVRGDIFLLHGDLYFTLDMLREMKEMKESCVVVDKTLPQPEKDFKARIEGERVTQIATYIHESNCFACQPLYKFIESDFLLWAEEIKEFCNSGNTNVYAEEALNRVLSRINLLPFDVHGGLCMEVDTPEDLEFLKRSMKEGK